CISLRLECSTSLVESRAADQRQRNATNEPHGPGAGRISQMARLYRSVVGAVSLMVTTVPATGVVAFCLCTQYVSPVGVKYWWTTVWFGPGVRAIGLS